MSRLLYNIWGPDYCDISFARITLHPDRAAWWLETMRPMVDKLWEELGFDFYGIEIWDREPDFLRTPVYGGALPEETVEEIEGNEMIELPDDLLLEEPNVEIARMEIVIAHVDRDGIFWRGREKHSDHEVETPRMMWERVQARAEASAPANNGGRLHCWWCGSRTEEVTLFTSAGCRCPECGK